MLGKRYKFFQDDGKESPMGTSDFSFLTTTTSHPIYLIVRKIPGGQKVQVFVGTMFILGLSAVPVLSKDERRGHNLFSQEKPEAVEERQQELKREYRQKRDAQKP